MGGSQVKRIFLSKTGKNNDDNCVLHNQVGGKVLRAN